MTTESSGGGSGIVRVGLAALMILAAVLLWRAGGRERQLAEAQRALLTLQHEEAARRFAALAEESILDRLSGMLSPGSADVEAHRAFARYWTVPELPVGADTAAGRQPGDPTSPESGVTPFLAANAAYRAAVEPGGEWRAVVGRLDTVINQYAEILRNDPGHRDAAFNYEFVVRYRTAIASRQRDLPPSGTGDEPAVTIHGTEGTPPPGGGTKEFRMMVPMHPEERREAEEAGRGGRRIRKG